MNQTNKSLAKIGETTDKSRVGGVGIGQGGCVSPQFPSFSSSFAPFDVKDNGARR
jgi:hypothetical protein